MAETETLFPGFDVSPDELDYDMLCRVYKHITRDYKGRARQDQEQYVVHLSDVALELAPLATTEKSAKVLREKLNDYRDGYRKRLKDVLSAKYGSMSAYITGASGFPGSRNASRIDREMELEKKLDDWSTRRREAIRNQLERMNTPRKPRNRKRP